MLSHLKTSSLRLPLVACWAFGGVLTDLLLASAGMAQPPLAVGSRRELFVEPTLIERLAGRAELRLHSPTPREVVLDHDAPWEGSGCVYHSLFLEGGKYRLYYAAGHLEVTERGVDAGSHGLFCCYAESTDGLRWVKPELGLHEYQGSRANNIVLVSELVGGRRTQPGEPAVFRDDNPAAPAAARYKALIPVQWAEGDARRALVAYQSPDGLRWTPLSPEPVITEGAFDSQNLAFWDAEAGCYRAYWRYFTGDGHSDAKRWDPQGDRAIRTAVSTDFLTWRDQHDLEYLDSPSEQLYTSQVKPYFRAPHLKLGFPARYVERGHADPPGHEARAPVTAERLQRWSPALRKLPEPQHREWRAKSSERYGRALSESLLMASRDGVRFQRWNEAFLRPGPERPGTWNYGQQFLAWGLVPTADSLPGGPGELSFYAVESYWTERSSLLRRYTLRLDGFVSLRAPRAGGELLTRPCTVAGDRLWLNFSTSAAGDVRVELQELDGTPLPGYSLAECDELFGDTVDRDVTWRGSAQLPALDRPIRLRFALRDADLFAWQFRPEAKPER
jgi:hypothetical protein